MRLTRRLALLASLAVASLATLATVAFATTVQVDPTETATTITVNGTADVPGGPTSGIGSTGTPGGTYAAHSDAVTVTLGSGTAITCRSDATFTIDITGTGGITQLVFGSCNVGCLINDVDTSTANTTPVTIVDGGFTVTGADTDTTHATFAFDGSVWTGTGGAGTGQTHAAEIAWTGSCPFVSLTCRWTTPTGTTANTFGQGENTGTVPLEMTLDEGAPATLTFTNATFDSDTISFCPNPDLTGTYTLNDPTTSAATGGPTHAATGTDNITVSP